METQARELLEHGLRDMHDAEQRFVQALGTMTENAKDPSLADGFRRHQAITRNHVRRLEQAFEIMGTSPQRIECPGARGLIREYEQFAQDHPGGDGIMDAFAASAGLKVEHYEIASYRALVDLAQFCDLGGCARLLKQNLAEEEQAAAEMQSAATNLGAELAGASPAAIAGRTFGAITDQMREGTLVSLGGAKSVAGRAVGSARKAVRTAERRGRTVRTKTARSTKARTRTGKTKTTTRRTGARATTARRKTTARATGARRKTTPGRSSTRSRRPAASRTRRKTATRRRTR
jgi:ferritin-like metal-binding protein YciE